MLVSVTGFGAIHCFFLAAELTFKVTFDSIQFHTGYPRYSGIRSGNILSRAKPLAGCYPPRHNIILDLHIFIVTEILFVLRLNCVYN